MATRNYPTPQSPSKSPAGDPPGAFGEARNLRDAARRLGITVGVLRRRIARDRALWRAWFYPEALIRAWALAVARHDRAQRAIIETSAAVDVGGPRAMLVEATAAEADLIVERYAKDRARRAPVLWATLGKKEANASTENRT
jgi:hypothetical protein